MEKDVTLGAEFIEFLSTVLGQGSMTRIAVAGLDRPQKKEQTGKTGLLL